MLGELLVDWIGPDRVMVCWMAKHDFHNIYCVQKVVFVRKEHWLAKWADDRRVYFDDVGVVKRTENFKRLDTQRQKSIEIPIDFMHDEL
jgi:hypothetical protein